MKLVWLLWGCDEQGSWLEAVYVDKVQAEAARRYLHNIDTGENCMYWIQEKEITK
jgi:uncharacterized protein (UPF0248 family)